MESEALFEEIRTVRTYLNLLKNIIIDKQLGRLKEFKLITTRLVQIKPLKKCYVRFERYGKVLTVNSYEQILSYIHDLLLKITENLLHGTETGVSVKAFVHEGTIKMILHTKYGLGTFLITLTNDILVILQARWE